MLFVYTYVGGVCVCIYNIMCMCVHVREKVCVCVCVYVCCAGACVFDTPWPSQTDILYVQGCFRMHTRVCVCVLKLRV